MRRLLVLLFVLPWWVYLPASIGVLWVGARVYEQVLETEAEKVAALAGGTPQVVDLAEFDRMRDIHAAGEVHVTGWIDTDINYDLTQGFNGIPLRTRHMYMVFGAAEQSGAREVRAALMLSTTERDQFVERIENYVYEVTDAGAFVLAFNGIADTTTAMDSMATEMIEKQGLSKAADFIFIEPFLDGREAALAPRGVPEQTRYIAWAIAAVVALIGVVKRVTSVRARPARGSEVDLTRGAEAAFDMGSEDVLDDTSPGRMPRRNAPAAPAAEEVLVYSAYGTSASGLYDDEDDGADDMFAESVAFESEADFDNTPESRFPPVPEDDELVATRQPQRSSAAAFYGKLALAMLLVGTLAYDPSLFNAALPVAGVALFWFGVYIAFARLRGKAKRRGGAGDGGAQIDLTPPVRSGGRKRGVI